MHILHTHHTSGRAENEIESDADGRREALAEQHSTLGRSIDSPIIQNKYCREKSHTHTPAHQHTHRISETPTEPTDRTQSRADDPMPAD